VTEEPIGDHYIPRANHGEGPALPGGGANKWDMKEALLSRAEVGVLQTLREGQQRSVG